MSIFNTQLFSLSSRAYGQLGIYGNIDHNKDGKKDLDVNGDGQVNFSDLYTTWEVLSGNVFDKEVIKNAQAALSGIVFDDYLNNRKNSDSDLDKDGKTTPGDALTAYKQTETNRKSGQLLLLTQTTFKNLEQYKDVKSLDVNQDGKVNDADRALIASVLTGKDTQPSSIQKVSRALADIAFNDYLNNRENKYADFNLDGDVTPGDSQEITVFLNGFLPEETPLPALKTKGFTWSG